VVDGGMNERNVCIGDIIRVGGEDGVVLQVSLPRVRPPFIRMLTSPSARAGSLRSVYEYVMNSFLCI
jgi:hypothetical protein